MGNVEMPDNVFLLGMLMFHIYRCPDLNLVGFLLCKAIFLTTGCSPRGVWRLSAFMEELERPPSH